MLYLYYTFLVTVLLLLTFALLSVLMRKLLMEKIFSLIAVFIMISFYLMLCGLEFLPLVILLLYVGAIAVLFLFVVMVLNPDQELILQELYKKQYEWLVAQRPQESTSLTLTQLANVAGTNTPANSPARPAYFNSLMYYFSILVFFYTFYHWSTTHLNAQDTNQLLTAVGSVDLTYFAELIYQDFSLAVILIGVMLLIAMMGAIVLTIRKSVPLKRQNNSSQFARYV